MGSGLVVAVNSVEGLVYVMAYACACIKIKNLPFAT